VRNNQHGCHGRRTADQVTSTAGDDREWYRHQALPQM